MLDIFGPDINGPCACFVTISHPSFPDEQAGDYDTNTLPIVHDIISLILNSTSIPIRSTSTLDLSLSLLPFHYILSPPAPISSDTIIPLSAARKSGKLSPADLVRVDLTMGKFLGQLHSRCQNDWFGLVQEKGKEDDPTKTSQYSWQETFSLLFESILSEIESHSREWDMADIPFRQIRLYFSRAIGFSLFDDVEVPCLIWFTGSEDDIYIRLNSEDTANLAAILPNVSHALWGDPLMETFFLETQSEAFLKAYKEWGGEDLMVFPRQKTKRIWYTLFLAFVVLKERGNAVYSTVTEGEGLCLAPSAIGTAWAKKKILQCAEEVKDAPYY